MFFNAQKNFIENKIPCLKYSHLKVHLPDEAFSDSLEK